MNSRRQILVTAFALFSLFFGAGNLILPPYLGYQAGDGWPLVLMGFVVSAVLIPIMAIYGHARLQGTILDFAIKMGKPFAVIYALVIYAIAISLPSPRTASVTYEMAIAPYFELSSLIWSTIYFILVLIFVLNRSRIISIIGKFLTPFILLILLVIIVVGLSIPVDESYAAGFTHPVSAGVLEGYQTFDAIGGVVVGGVIVVSLSLGGGLDYRQKRSVISRAGVLAGIGLIAVYGGLIALAAHFGPLVETTSRSELLSTLSTITLGNTGTAFLAVLVALACFTTAVGIVAGTADFFTELLGGSKRIFVIAASCGSLIGILVGQFGVEYIIDVAVPALMFIYPLTIVLIVLSVLPKKYSTSRIFSWVVVTVLIFTIPDFLQSVIEWETIERIDRAIPLSSKNLGWVMPSLAVLLIGNIWISRSPGSA
jgi:LIVCS family branched-chain amino acid:cation transporter